MSLGMIFYFVLFFIYSIWRLQEFLNLQTYAMF